MATGPRTPRTSTRPVYETFEPKSEMKEKEEAYFVHVYLPGFTKERIKINFVRSSRVVRVIGERPLGGNRISNFEHTYPVPENCEVEKLQGKYDREFSLLQCQRSPFHHKFHLKHKWKQEKRVQLQ
ncbi:Inactive protein RESTRICTED TEV MOVEMENT 2 [Spatholobus suberectus]|nr:Inactive protein RESTRICTED TEV MOVEMENT 2 [Spatholobus suberectus]